MPRGRVLGAFSFKGSQVMTTVQRTASATPELHYLHPSHFAYRHIGPRRPDVGEMMAVLGYDSI
jgi:hypothetical protein